MDKEYIGLLQRFTGVVSSVSKSLNKHDIAILKYLIRLNKPVYQNDIPKATGMNLKVVTKSLYKLEKMGLVKRESAIHNKRRTYLVTIEPEKIKPILEEHGEILQSVTDVFLSVSDIPCITCLNIQRCYEGGFFDPVYCQYLWNYLLDKPRR